MFIHRGVLARAGAWGARGSEGTLFEARDGDGGVERGGGACAGCGVVFEEAFEEVDGGVEVAVRGGDEFRWEGVGDFVAVEFWGREVG